MFDGEILVNIPTKNRPRELCRLLASLHAQTFQNFDVMIIDESDQTEYIDEYGKMWLGALSKGRDVVIQEGMKINQDYAHNMALWDVNAPEYILRLDDDLILNADFIESLYIGLRETGAGAVAGLYFDERMPRDDNKPISTGRHCSTEVLRDGTSRAVAQMVDYLDFCRISAEHLYSACLYKRDAMRGVGGWPLVYSDSVAHREETDGTHRMFLAGHELYIDPAAKAKHEHASGGIRTLTDAEVESRRHSDDQLWQQRNARLRGVNYCPTVAVCTHHVDGVGGAQRLAYSLVEVLRGLFPSVDFLPMGDRKIMSSEKQTAAFGFCVDSRPNPESPDHYDVVITLGHEPPDAAELPPRRHHIHYNLYPTTENGIPKHVDRMVSISEYSATAARIVYRRNPEVIYPFVHQVVDFDGIEKENAIIVVGDLSRGKGVSHLVQAFLSLDVPGVTLHIVTPEIKDDEESEYILNCSKSYNINLHVGISAAELKRLYKKSKVLWAARGFGMGNKAPALYSEHFGYTPAEALRFACLPVAYNGGGYKETCVLRWETMNELVAATKAVMTNKHEWERVLAANLDLMPAFSLAAFRTSWERVIRSTNAFAWESQINEWRKPGGIRVSSEFHIACISDSPNNPTGYGVIAKQVYKGFVESGMKVHVFALNDHRCDEHDEYYRWTSCPKNVESVDPILADFAKNKRFDSIFVCRDPKTASKFVRGMRSLHRVAPITAYVSQEGTPAHVNWAEIFNHADSVITMSRSSADAVHQRFGERPDVVYPGVDHADWRHFGVPTRQALRDMVGWDNKFIILCVARNTRNKRLPGILKVAKTLRDDYGMDDVLVVLGTKVLGDARFGGHDLMMWADMLGLDPWSELVVVEPGLEADGDPDDLLRRAPPITIRDKVSWLQDLSMVALYNMADVYVDMSSAEGFGMPAMEAMACGIPVVSVEDYYVRSEIMRSRSGSGNLAVDFVTPSSVVDEWVNGADLQLVDPVAVARTVAELRNENAVRSVRAHALSFRWDDARSKILEVVNCRR